MTHATHIKREPTLISDALELAKFRAMENAQSHARQHRAALHHMDVQDAIAPPMATRPRPADTRGVQSPATVPDAPSVHFIDHATMATARYVAVAVGAMALFIAGVAVGRVL